MLDKRSAKQRKRGENCHVVGRWATACEFIYQNACLGTVGGSDEHSIISFHFNPEK